MRGLIAICVSVLLFAPSVSAAETVVTARVAGVRHVVVDTRGNIQQIVSNTSEDVAPIIHLSTFEGEQVAMTKEIEVRYLAIISKANMEQAGIVYTRNSPLKALIAHLSHTSILPLKPTL